MEGCGDKLGNWATLFLRCRFGSGQTRSGERAPNSVSTARPVAMMPRQKEAGVAIYRYSFHDGAKQTQETREANFAHDKQAIDNGAAIIAGHHSDRMEIWRGTRLVQSFGPVSSPDPKRQRR